ncbi:MAG: dihydrodipicolinate synthase family protein [Enterobacteriaceae bacterium]
MMPFSASAAGWAARRGERSGGAGTRRGGDFSDPEEQANVIRAFVKSVDDKLPIIAGITGEGRKGCAGGERAVAAGASAGLLYPSHGWLRFGYQDGAPQDRYRVVYEESGLPLILFQYPDVTKATYNLKTLLDISAQPGVFAMKNGVRNMRRWDTEIPVIRRERPDLQILSCHDEYLLHTAFDVDGFLVGYGNIAPEPLIEMIKAGKAGDYVKARELHDRLLPVTKASTTAVRTWKVPWPLNMLWLRAGSLNMPPFALAAAARKWR